jgi:hypothetical protein
MTSMVSEWLQSAGLAGYEAQLLDRGVTDASFQQLAIHDFASLGVIDATHRQRLFMLIETVKREFVEPSPPPVNANRSKDQPIAPEGNDQSMTDRACDDDRHRSIPEVQHQKRDRAVRPDMERSERPSPKLHEQNNPKHTVSARSKARAPELSKSGPATLRPALTAKIKPPSSSFGSLNSKRIVPGNASPDYTYRVRPPSASSSVLSHPSIRVVVRKRPINSKEVQSNMEA